MENMDDRVVCTDAVHHRLAPEETLLTVYSLSRLNYGCYDCERRFASLQDLLEHSQDPEFPFHSQEVCLKCQERVTVVMEAVDGACQVSRLHSCNRSKLRQQNADLFCLSEHVARKLDSSDITPGDSAPSVFCSLCPKACAPSSAGLYRYLKHSNKWMHNVSTYCRACGIPVFFAEYNDSKIICHLCAKHSRPSVIVKPKEQA